jgi:hypothetical protein
MWVRRNQRRLGIELYSGLKDVVTRGDTTCIYWEKNFFTIQFHWQPKIYD